MRNPDGAGAISIPRLFAANINKKSREIPSFSKQRCWITRDTLAIIRTTGNKTIQTNRGRRREFLIQNNRNIVGSTKTKRGNFRASRRRKKAPLGQENYNNHIIYIYFVYLDWCIHNRIIVSVSSVRENYWKSIEMRRFFFFVRLRRSLVH